MTDLIQAPSSWHLFLEQHGAHFDGAPADDLRHFGAAPNPDLRDNFIAPLTDLGLISMNGDDAASFLHNQLTNEVEKLDLGSARLAGYCTAKGRLLATFLMWKEQDQIVLQLPRALLPAIQKRLQMFILRAKVKLTDISAQRVAVGMVGVAAADALRQWFPVLPAQPYDKIDHEHGTLIRVADSRDAPRYQWLTSPEQWMAAWPVLMQRLTPAGAPAWRLTDIYAGVPTINQATQEQFVPQMVNFELIGGVNFKKGCYPGQEIVARSQYLGKLKRRTVLALVDAAVAQPGMEIFSSEDPGQPCGMVVNAEPAAAGRWACLVEVKLAATDAGSIHLGAGDGPALQLQPLPYALTQPQ